MATAPRNAGRRGDARPDSDADYERRRRDGLAWRAWYGLRRWRARAKAQLADEPLCRMCAAEGRVTAATVADHIEPHRGDPALFWAGALQSLCAPHHNRAKQRAEAAARHP